MQHTDGAFGISRPTDMFKVKRLISRNVIRITFLRNTTEYTLKTEL